MRAALNLGRFIGLTQGCRGRWPRGFAPFMIAGTVGDRHR